MTRDEFEEKLNDFGRTFSEEASCFEWGSHFSSKEREELRAEIMAEFDNLVIQANSPCPECGDRGRQEPECKICDDTGIIKHGYAGGWACGCKKGQEIEAGFSHL